MKRPDQAFEYDIENILGLVSFSTFIELNFGSLDVSVAEMIPDEFM